MSNASDSNQIQEGIVEGITSFGAFIKLEDGRKGLVHISEVAKGFVKEIGDHLNVNDSVKVKILGEDENGRLRLSIKQAVQEEPAPQSQTNFEEIIAKYMKQSEERQLDLKRNLRKKSGSGYRGKH